jgi:putative ABC transport system ATP-binding protein
MIRLENVTQTFRTRQGPLPGLKDVNLEVKSGEFLVVRGPSGCGKTTLLLTMGGMLKPSQGSVWVEGLDVYSLLANERSRFRAQNIGFVFQMFHLVPYLNVLENVLLSGTRNSLSAPSERARELLCQLGLEARLRHRPGELSAGERQRTAVARALLNQPKVILADEPTGNLDPESGGEVFRYLDQYHRHGGTVVVVTHGPEANPYADRVIELRTGTVQP